MPAHVHPDAIYRPIFSATDKGMVPAGVVIHVAAGEASSLFYWFGGDHDSDGDNSDGPAGGIESHFYVRYDGSFEQYRPVNVDADANYQANAYMLNGVRRGWVSIENQGLAAGKFTAAQLATNLKIIEWMHTEYGIPLRVPTATDWMENGGVGYHVMFGAPGPWTTANGKTCPGPDRIKQYWDVIVPWMDEKNKGVKVYLPIEKKHAVTHGDGSRQSDVAAIARIMNHTFDLDLPEDGSWPPAMTAAVLKHIPGSGSNGEWISGKQYANLMIELSRSFTVDIKARQDIDAVEADLAGLTQKFNTHRHKGVVSGAVRDTDQHIA